MDDLISRAAAIEAMRECWRRVNQFAKPFEANRIMDCIKAVKELPAVDAAPIIRCANCKWWNGSTLGTAHRCAALHIATTGEFYCAAAERKSNAFADQSGAEYADNTTV
jgi:hypothetical protein